MKFTNKLIEESSPYLLQHAHNPVNWFPWGDEAISLAKQQDKPILVSIGYAACHWCHVMEKESFENETTASYMNEHFINIKIDREERPDLDHIYMDAVQAIAGNGGWPLNVFLTTDLKPFYGGTYFPPVKAFNRSSWMEVLALMKDAWVNRRDEIEEQAEMLTNHIGNASSMITQLAVGNSENFYQSMDAGMMADSLLKNADTEYGGFGNAPKFPQTFSISYLLMYGYFYDHLPSSTQALLSLDRLLSGGIYDHLAGGLCRYSTDREWLVPHFEKMLYDNALLMCTLSEAFQVTGKKEYEVAISSIYDFLQAEMRSDEGGYFAAIDADSEGVEGKFYVWQKTEVEKIIGDDAEICCKWFGITDKGNWEGENILTQHHTIETFAELEDISVMALEEKIMSWKKELLLSRNKRSRPALDDKILLGWNALLVTGLCKAYAATGKQQYVETAISLFDFLSEKFKTASGHFLHTYKNGKAKLTAYLDDYANYIQAAIYLQEITGVQQYLVEAKRCTEIVIDRFTAGETLFYYTDRGQENIVVRKVDLYDGAVPSGNSVMTENLYYLSVVFDKPEWEDRAHQCLQAVKNTFIKYPASFGIWAKNFLKHVLGVQEIVITGKQAPQMLKDFLKLYIPNTIVQTSEGPQEMALLKGKAYDEQVLIYLCKNHTCKQPVKTLLEIKALLNLKP